MTNRPVKEKVDSITLHKHFYTRKMFMFSFLSFENEYFTFINIVNDLALKRYSFFLTNSLYISVKF